MKVIIQRVVSGSVAVDGDVIGRVDRGYVVLVGVRHGDTEEDARQLARKTVNLRVFPDDQGRMNRSVEDVGGGVLAISQFTLYASTRKGNRPSFTAAADPESAERLYETYVEAVRRALGDGRVQTGQFGAHMVVGIVNDGPVTIELSTDPAGTPPAFSDT